MATTDIPVPAALPKLNARGETSEALENARADPLVRETAHDRYREDYERFGVALP